mmetsp:Transcript_18385/g.52678  ORF Transcript_18385/g.52678 Transcript_18385/m.52678 type:complete len:323 (-) Transcript_18385:7-975(-)
MENGRVLHKHLANAVAVNMIVLHLLGGESPHPIDQGRLLDDVDCGVEIEPPRREGLEVAQVQVWVCQAILRTRQHACINELVARDLPLPEHGIQVHPIKGELRKVDVDHHGLHAIEQEPRRAEHRGDHALLREVGELRAREVWRLQTLVALGLQVVVDKVHEVAVDATCGDGEALLGLGLLPLCQVCPGEFHLLVHAADEHRVLGPRGNSLEHEEGRDLVLLEGLQLFVDEAEDAWRDATEGISERILQRLNGAQPEDRVHANTNTTEPLELALVQERLVREVGLQMPHTHCCKLHEAREATSGVFDRAYAAGEGVRTDRCA